MGGRRLIDDPRDFGGGFRRQTVGDMFQELYETRPAEAEDIRQLLLFALRRKDLEDGVPSGNKRMAFVAPRRLRLLARR